LEAGLNALNVEPRENQDQVFSVETPPTGRTSGSPPPTTATPPSPPIYEGIRDRLTELSSERWWSDKDDEATLREQGAGFD
jgi:hypothetical protein